MEAVHVPYKGGGQAIGDVIAGHVPMTITSVQATKGLVESGKVKALAVTSPTRSPAMPNVPTMQEAGVPPADVELRFWFAIFGPKGLPRPGQGPSSPRRFRRCWPIRRSRERLAKLDITPDVIAAPALHAKLESEIKNWTRFIDAKGIKAAIAPTNGEVPHPQRPRHPIDANRPPVVEWLTPGTTIIGRASCWHLIRLVLDRSARCWRDRCAGAGAELISRPAGPFRHRLPAGRRDRHVLPADSTQALGSRARPAGRDREPRRRRRLYRLAAGRDLAARRLHAAGGGERDSASTRRSTRSIRRASIRSRTIDAIGAMASTPLVL